MCGVRVGVFAFSASMVDVVSWLFQHPRNMHSAPLGQSALRIFSYCHSEIHSEDQISFKTPVIKAGVVVRVLVRA